MTIQPIERDNKRIIELEQENATLKAAIKWASDKAVFAHFNHEISDEEWEYFVTELKRRSEGGGDGALR